MKVSKFDELKSEIVFKGVTRKILMHSTKMMIVYYEIEPEVVFPEHSHPHEQMGFIIQGQCEIKNQNETKIAKKGTAYFFPSNEKHSVKTIGNDKCLIIDAFHPPRQDFLKK